MQKVLLCVSEPLWFIHKRTVEPQRHGGTEGIVNKTERNVSSKGLIEPRILKGFRDYLPSITIARLEMIRKLERVFASFGFVPIDTPALEYAEILLGKGSDETDKQLYRFLDQGERDVALRFDLTVPFARFTAMHLNELAIPFKRFHIAPVWRAEKPQRGRYREFIQCDFDIIGTDSVLADAEIVAVIHRALTALEINHQIRINNRNLLNGLLQSLGAAGKSVPVLRAIDKLEKLGREVVHEELAREASLSSKQIEDIFTFLALSTEVGDNAHLIQSLRDRFQGNDQAVLGISQLETILSTLPSYEIQPELVRIDLSITRGLDYYTGTVYETTFLDLPGIGSICSGGRYDNLAQLYTKQRLPGVGTSIGLDRILGAFEELKRLAEKSATADVLIALVDEPSFAQAINLSTKIRNAGLNAEVYPEIGKLGAQLKYGSKKGIRYVIIAGEREVSNRVVSIKDLVTGTQTDNVPIGDVVSQLKVMF